VLEKAAERQIFAEQAESNHGSEAESEQTPRILRVNRAKVVSDTDIEAQLYEARRGATLLPDPVGSRPWRTHETEGIPLNGVLSVC
jgi:hypothetical protein